MDKEEFDTLRQVGLRHNLGVKLTIEEFMSKLPSELPFDMKCDVYLTGGLGKTGETMHDIDLIVEPYEAWREYRFVIETLFRRLLDRLITVGWKVYETVAPRSQLVR